MCRKVFILVAVVLRTVWKSTKSTFYVFLSKEVAIQTLQSMCVKNDGQGFAVSELPFGKTKVRWSDDGVCFIATIADLKVGFPYEQ